MPQLADASRGLADAHEHAVEALRRPEGWWGRGVVQRGCACATGSCRLRDTTADLHW